MVQDVFKVSPDPEGAGPILPDPPGAGSVSPDPSGVGSVLPDPEGTGPVSPEPSGVGFVSPDGDPYRLQPLRVYEYDPMVKLLTPGGKRARLDMTRGHDGPYLAAHIANSVGRASAVLPNPRTASNRSTY